MRTLLTNVKKFALSLTLPVTWVNLWRKSDNFKCKSELKCRNFVDFIS